MSNLVKLVTEADIDSLTDKVVLDQFNELLNQEPPNAIVKQHPTAKNVKYIPIDKVEILLTKFFQDWYVEILKTSQILNSVATDVRLHYFHPIKKEWRYQDGTGAVAVQTAKGAAASDMGSIVSDGVMKALPASKSYAIKDAAEHLGKIFGRDLNRKDTIAFSGEYSKDDAEKKKEEMRNKVRTQNNASS